MKQNIVAAMLVLVITLALTACAAETADDSAGGGLDSVIREYLANQGVDAENIAIFPETVIRSADGDLQLTVPGFWHELGLCRVETPTGAVAFSFYEPYTQEHYDAEAGWEWSLLRYTFDDYAAQFGEYPLEESYDEILPPAFYIIGWDQQYVYLLQIPTDVQFDPENELSAALFNLLQEGSQQIIENFLAVNQITPNPDCPANECYTPEQNS